MKKVKLRIKILFNLGRNKLVVDFLNSFFFLFILSSKLLLFVIGNLPINLINIP